RPRAALARPARRARRRTARRRGVERRRDRWPRRAAPHRGRGGRDRHRPRRPHRPRAAVGGAGPGGDGGCRQHRSGAPGRRRRHAGRLAVRPRRPGRALAPLPRATPPVRRPGRALPELAGPGMPRAGSPLPRGRHAGGGRGGRRRPRGRRCRGGVGMNILIWHVHGSWTTAFVQGDHRYLLPTLPERGAWGGGRPAAWDWPADAVELSPAELADADVDVVVLQRPEEAELAAEWLGRVPGRDVPAVYLEHNAPREHAATTRHPFADRDDLLLVHVTHFNALMWDAGNTRTAVIEHGVLDPGARWTGELRSAAVCINEPVRRGRITGTDLLPVLAEVTPLDVFGIGVERLAEHCPNDRVRPVADLP